MMGAWDDFGSVSALFRIKTDRFEFHVFFNSGLFVVFFGIRVCFLSSMYVWNSVGFWQNITTHTKEKKTPTIKKKSWSAHFVAEWRENALELDMHVSMV